VDDLTKYFVLAGGPAAVACLGWWLSGKFQEVKDDAQAMLKSHELRDNKRHEDNLNRFNAIEVQLAGLTGRASDNGHRF
jgi:hypothetical protein